MDSGAANRKGYSQVGFDGEGTVIKAQGIVSDTGAVPEKDGCLLMAIK